MSSRSPALAFAAVGVAALLAGLYTGVGVYLPFLVSDRGVAPAFLLAVEAFGVVVSPLLPVAVGARFAAAFDLTDRLPLVVVATVVVADVGYGVGRLVAALFSPDSVTAASPVAVRAAAFAVDSTLAAVSIAVAVVAGAAVARLRATA
ncbi:hypothetical protein [Halosegnis marinus]|uniref:Major facilitator superfamily (MFS) profile domain-containing protein n=1 Tax=Halosegnis marinus TaxID=3034023 RepID=A0ABD5ZQT0_9EURY|nr:hypothetical protein [Halosegnis sp. DT85]